LVTHHLYRSPSVCGGTESAPLRGRGEARERCFCRQGRRRVSIIFITSAREVHTICILFAMHFTRN
jgi:hypothetical protein